MGSEQPPLENAEAALRELATHERKGADAELFRCLVESVSDYAIFMLDPLGRIATWNIGAQRIKGYRADEILGQHFAVFYPDEDVRAGKCVRSLDETSREGRFEDEGWRVRKDGSRFWANVIISAMHNEQGALVGFSKVTRDLTERNRMQEEQVARLAAEHANRAKDELLAMLGHELRNPLAPIVTALQLMKLRGEPRTSKEQQIIERHVGHMMRLVDDLLDISRITKGTIELKKRRVDIRDVMAAAVESASPLLEQRGHHFEVDAPEDAIVVDADEARLTQVFSHLIVNAAKYTHTGGDIGLFVRHDGDEVIAEVRDDGVGIEPDLLPKLFDLFVQGRQGADRSSGGLGIGLTLVRSLVGVHGGKVEARSPGAGMGSTFSVRLPVAGAPAGDVMPGSVVFRRGGRTRRLLIVDDNEDVTFLLPRSLRASATRSRQRATLQRRSLW